MGVGLTEPVIALALLQTSGVALGVIATATALVATSRRRRACARPRREGTARLDDHYVVWGYGARAEDVAAVLRDADVPLAVVPEDDDQLRSARRSHIAVAPGESLGERLCAAAVGSARGLVVMSNVRPERALLVAAARARSHRLFIVATSEDEAEEECLITAGADCVVTDRFSARRVVELLPEFHDRDLETDGVPAMCASELTITCESLATLADSGTEELDRGASDLVVAVRRGGRLVRVRPPETALEEGDVLVLVGSEAAVATVDSRLRPRSTR